jgi:hypothetical protein
MESKEHDNKSKVFICTLAALSPGRSLMRLRISETGGSLSGYRLITTQTISLPRTEAVMSETFLPISTTVSLIVATRPMRSRHKMLMTAVEGMWRPLLLYPGSG